VFLFLDENPLVLSIRWMDGNLIVLLILLALATLVGLGAVLMQSRRIRSFGLIGALRRKFSGGAGRSRYGN